MVFKKEICSKTKLLLPTHNQQVQELHMNIIFVKLLFFAVESFIDKLPASVH